jgi:hypothetical protein
LIFCRRSQSHISPNSSFGTLSPRFGEALASIETTAPAALSRGRGADHQPARRWS